MSKNNVKQEAKEMKPTGEVVLCTMTEKEHEQRKEYILNAQARGREAEWAIMTALVSAKERHEQTLDGFDDTETGFNNWVMSLFEIKDTQVKQMIRIVRKYGDLADNGEWSVQPKFIAYGKEKLDIIQRHNAFKTKGDFDNIVTALDINPYTSTSIIRDLINQANGKALPDKETDKEQPTKEEKAAKKSEQEIKESDIYKEVVSVSDELHAFITKWLGYAKDEKMDDKKFRAEFIKNVEQLMKTTK